MQNRSKLIGGARLMATSVLALCGWGGWGPSTPSASAQTSDPAPRSVTRGMYYPEVLKLMVRDQAGVRLRLLNRVGCPDCDGGSYFGTRWTIEVERENVGITTVNVVGPVQVDDMQIVDQARAILVGRSQSSVAGVVIFNIATGAVIDKFIGFDPDVSPDGRWVAYIKVFPLHFVEGVSSMYLLYDTARPPSYHRQPGVGQNDEIDVGLPLYPLDAQNVPSDNLNVIPSLRHQITTDGFYWSSDSTKLLFGDVENGGQSVVVVDLALLANTLREATPPLGISTVPLDHTAIVDATKCQSFAGMEGDAFTISSVEFLNEASVRLQFASSRPCLRLSTLDVELP